MKKQTHEMDINGLKSTDDKLTVLSLMIAALGEKVETLTVAMVGDIENGEPGYIRRTESLEQSASIGKWLVALILAAVVTSFFNSCQARDAIIAWQGQPSVAQHNATPTPSPTATLKPSSTPVPGAEDLRDELEDLKRRNDMLQSKVDRLLDIVEEGDDDEDSYIPSELDDNIAPGGPPSTWVDVP